MTIPLSRTRRFARALMLTCALVPAALAGQSSTTSTTAKNPAAKTTPARPHKTTSSTTAGKSGAAAHTSSSAKSRRKKSTRARGQQKIDSERARTIQTALIREHYLSGEPAGTWNQASEDAMRRYQGDHGWQTKEVPDSRALISLGLGPSKDHLLNPESAMTTAPTAPDKTTTQHSDPSVPARPQ